MPLPGIDDRLSSLRPICEANEQEPICSAPADSASPKDSYIDHPKTADNFSWWKVPVAILLSPIAIPVAIFGASCGGGDEGPIKDAPSSNPTINPPTDNPPVITGGGDGGFGMGINKMFANSKCEKPVDLDVASMANVLLMTCGDQDEVSRKPGTGLIEKIDISSGTVTELRLDPTIDGDPTKPFHLTSTVRGDNSTLYVGVAASGSKAQFESGERRFSSSAILTTNEAGMGRINRELFAELQLRDFHGAPIAISLAGVNGQDTTVGSIQPNTPVSLAEQGSRLFSLLENRTLNNGGGMVTTDFASLAICRFLIDAMTGALSPEPVPAEIQHPVIAGSDQPHNCLLLDGFFKPTAIASVGPDRIAVLVRGLDGMNSSSLHVLNAADFSSGLNEAPTGWGIALTDVDSPDSPDFVANSSSQLPIVNNRYALVGGGDSSGRIAIVDLDRDGPTEGTRTEFIGLFDDQSSIASIVVSADEKFAYVLSDTGKVRTVTLTEENFGATGQIFDLASVPKGSPLVAALAANAVVVASPGKYSKAPIGK